MGCNCGGSNKVQQQTGTLQAVDQGEGRAGWYWTGPSGGANADELAPAAPAAAAADDSTAA